MTIDETGSGRPPWTTARVAVDAIAYAVVVAVGTLALSLAGGLVTGGGLVRAKLLTFLAGWLLLAVATVRLWPRSPTEGGADVVTGNPRRPGTTEVTRIEAIARTLPPLRWMRPPPRRLSPPAKLFVGALCVLLASLTLEVVFAVG